MDNKKSDTSIWKIQAVVNGNTLTYNNCELITEADPMFLRFLDKFGVMFRYNKNNIVCMELLK